MSPYTGNYQAALIAAGEMLGRVNRQPRLPGHAGAQYAAVLQGAKQALADELSSKDPQAPRRADVMARVYNDFLYQYAGYAAQNPVAPEIAPFYGRYLQTTQHPEARAALDALRQHVNGPNVLTNLFYDERKAKREDSGWSGVRWGGILGAGVGALAGGIFGIEGVWGAIIRVTMGIGFALGGNMLQEALTGSAPVGEGYPVPYSPGGNTSPRLGTAVSRADFKHLTGEEHGLRFPSTSVSGPAEGGPGPRRALTGQREDHSLA